MALSLIDKTTLYGYMGITSSDVNDTYVTALVAAVNAMAEQYLGDIFELQESQTVKYEANNHPVFIVIGAWQETGLVVKRGHREDESDLDTLTKGEDYDLVKLDNDYPNRTAPIVAIKLVGAGLTDREFLQIEGTQGYLDSVPAELMLQMKLYDVLARIVYSKQEAIENQGKGRVTSSRIGKIAISFNDAERVTEEEGMDQLNTLMENIRDRYLTADYMFASIVG